MRLHILVVGLHVYLLQKIIKILEEDGHFVVAVFSSDMIGKNLRTREFDLILINRDVNPRLRIHVEKAIQRYQPDCPVQEAIYDKTELISSLPQ